MCYSPNKKPYTMQVYHILNQDEHTRICIHAEHNVVSIATQNIISFYLYIGGT